MTGMLSAHAVVQRVRAVTFTEKDGRLLCQRMNRSRNQQDLDDDLKARILADIKLTIHEMSSRFSGSEQFTEPIDRMDSVDQIMGFVMPFLPVHLAEKQALLEIVSVQER